MVTHVGSVVAPPTADPVSWLATSASVVDLAVLAQSTDPAAGTLLQYVGTFLVAALFYGVTAHVAARYVLGSTPATRALAVGTLPALASILLQQWGFLVVAPAALVVDFVGFHAIYRVKYRTAALCAVMHFTISVIVGVALSTILIAVLG